MYLGRYVHLQITMHTFKHLYVLRSRISQNRLFLQILRKLSLMFIMNLLEFFFNPSSQILGMTPIKLMTKPSLSVFTRSSVSQGWLMSDTQRLIDCRHILIGRRKNASGGAEIEDRPIQNPAVFQIVSQKSWQQQKKGVFPGSLLVNKHWKHQAWLTVWP